MNAAMIAARALAFSSGWFAMEAQHGEHGGLVAFLHHEDGRMMRLGDAGDEIAWSTPEGVDGRGDELEAFAAIEQWMHEAMRLNAHPGVFAPYCTPGLASLAARALA